MGRMGKKTTPKCWGQTKSGVEAEGVGNLTRKNTEKVVRTATRRRHEDGGEKNHGVGGGARP